MFSLVRFIRCSPFDEWNAWKTWIDKSPMGQKRMNTLVKSLLLRRTKDQKSTVTGKEIVPLPDKEVIVHQVKLTEEENKVYQEVSVPKIQYPDKGVGVKKVPKNSDILHGWPLTSW